MVVPAPRHAEWQRGRRPLGEPRERIDRSLPRQGYRLTITADAISLDVADPAGAAYGRITLAGLTDDDGLVSLGSVTDWPDVPVRGVMLDISRSKVPTMATLRSIVDRMADLKLNQLQLYMEHTFAYAGHEAVWAEASPMTADEMAELAAYCRARHVELVPNQNCLGHMERWLRHERYRPLAICPDGWTFPIGASSGGTHH